MDRDVFLSVEEVMLMFEIDLTAQGGKHTVVFCVKQRGPRSRILKVQATKHTGEVKQWAGRLQISKDGSNELLCRFTLLSKMVTASLFSVTLCF